jgi:integrase
LNRKEKQAQKEKKLTKGLFPINSTTPIKSRREIESIKQSLTPGRNRLLFIMCINTGLKIESLLAIKIKDVRHGVLEIVEERRGKTRKVTLSDAIMDEIKRIDGDPDDYLFRSRNGRNKHLTRQQAFRALSEAGKRSGYGSVSGNVMRKTFAYFAIKSGMDADIVAEILGHDSTFKVFEYIGESELIAN